MDIYTILININKDQSLINSYLNLCKDSISCSYESHHILPRKMYPEYKKSSWNICKISPQNHLLAHWYLYRIFQNKEMAFAFVMMGNMVGIDFDNFKGLSKEDVLRLSFDMDDAKELSKLTFTHMMQNSISITNGIIHKLIDNDSSIPEGWVRGRIPAFERGTRVAVSKDNISKFIPKDDLQKYLMDGYTIGCINNTGIFVTNGVENIKVASEDIPYGYFVGRTNPKPYKPYKRNNKNIQSKRKNKIYIHNSKTGEQLFVDKLSQIPDGFVKGILPNNSPFCNWLPNYSSIKYKKYSNTNGNIVNIPDFLIPPEGYSIGIKKSNHTKNRIHIHNPITKENRMIYPDDIIPNGFVKGRYIQARKKYIYYNNGIDNFKFLDGETIPPFLIKGKIKIIKNKRVYICDNFGNISWIASEEDIPESYHILSKDEKIKFFSRK